MENINWALSVAKITGLPPRSRPVRGEGLSRELSVIRTGDFVRLMKLIAEHDLWDDLETELVAQGCSNFRIGALPMQLVGGHIRGQVAAGALPVETLDRLVAASCVLCPPITGVGRVVNPDGTVPAMPPGTSEGDRPDGGADGGVGSEDKPQ